jgi:hypothetical protein
VDYEFGYGQGEQADGRDDVLNGLLRRLDLWRRQHAERIRRLSKEVGLPPDAQDAMSDLRRSFDAIKDAVRSYLSR